MDKIVITGQMTLSQVNEVLRSKFHFLKMAFFSQTHKEGVPSARSTMLHSGKILADLAGVSPEATLVIHPQMTVTEVESQFQEIFKIGVQVLRQSGPLWLQTTTTDHWTMEKQNKEGRTDSIPVI